MPSRLIRSITADCVGVPTLPMNPKTLSSLINSATEVSVIPALYTSSFATRRRFLPFTPPLEFT